MIGGLPRPALDDLDGDGDIDLFLTVVSGDTYLYENVGTPEAAAFADPVLNPSGVGPFDDAYATLADTDGDGDADLVIGHPDGSLEFYENLTIPAEGEPAGDFAFGPAEPVAGSPSTFGGARPELGDLNGDGDLDLLVAYASGDWAFLDAPLAPSIVGEPRPHRARPPSPPAAARSAFRASLTNNGDDAATLQARVVAVLPNGKLRTLFETDVTLGAGKTGSKTFAEPVPSGAPAGTYTVRLEADGETIGGFEFVKQGVALAETLSAEAQDASVLLTWTGAGRYEVQRLVGEAGLYESLGIVEGEGALRFRTGPLAAGAHRFRIQPLAASPEAEAWTEAADVEAVVGLTGTHRLSDIVPNPFGASGATFTLAVAEEQDVRSGSMTRSGARSVRLHKGLWRRAARTGSRSTPAASRPACTSSASRAATSPRRGRSRSFGSSTRPPLRGRQRQRGGSAEPPRGWDAAEPLAGRLGEG